MWKRILRDQECNSNEHIEDAIPMAENDLNFDDRFGELLPDSIFSSCSPRSAHCLYPRTDQEAFRIASAGM
jgi:hypothetical protein